MRTNGHNLDQHLVGWLTDERLARIVIHIDVAQSIFDHHPTEHSREFQSPEEMYAYAEKLREYQASPRTLFQNLLEGIKVITPTLVQNSFGKINLDSIRYSLRTSNSSKGRPKSSIG